MQDLPTNQSHYGTGFPCHGCRIRQLVKDLEAVGVNVIGFLEQALDGERIVQRTTGNVPNDAWSILPTTEALAAEIRKDAEWSRVPFAPTFLWNVRYLRNRLWEGDWTDLDEEVCRRALKTLTDALADRRTGTHGKPTPGGVLARRDHGEQLARKLAWIAESAVRTLQVFGEVFTRKENAETYEADLRETQFWTRLQNSDQDDPENLRHELETIFDPISHPGRPNLGRVTVAMVTALMGGNVDPRIFGGPGKPDERATSRSLAIRALRMVRPENLEIPGR